MDVAGWTPVVRAVVFVLCVLPALLAGGCGRRHAEPERRPTAVGQLWNSGRHALGVALRHPEDVVDEAPGDAERRPWAYCTDRLLATGLDLEAENRAAEEALRRRRERTRYDAIVVPGFTPLDVTAPQRAIHVTAVERLVLAQRDLAAGLAPVIVVSGGNVHPPDTPVNEAMQMKEWLLAHGTPAERIIVEPCARHSHTNLRNAGRFLLTHGLRSAVITTSLDQALYFGRPRTSSFDGRCVADLGYVVGELHDVDANHVSFVPSGRNFDRGPDPLDP